jgi:hypothetical protein
MTLPGFEIKTFLDVGDQRFLPRQAQIVTAGQ